MKLLDQCDVERFTAGGPGGQHRNKTQSGIRLVHRATGIVVSATERRSQHANLAVALERMAERLAARARVRKVRVPSAPTAGAKRRRVEQKRRRGDVKRGRAAEEE